MNKDQLRIGIEEAPALCNYAGLLLLLICTTHPCLGSARTSTNHQGSLTIRVPSPESDVLSAVEAIARDPIIRGTYQFDKDRTLTGAKSVDSSSYFGPWSGAGKAFYKIADGILSPVGFKESADMGTITVRYVVQSVDASDTTVRIDSVFVESAHRAVHPSEGSVEAAEYGAIREQLEKIDADRRKTNQEIQRVTMERADASAAREAASRRTRVSATSQSAVPESAVPESAIQGLEKQVATLRKTVQTRVRDSATPLKAAPYKSAATLTSLPLNTDVVVLILTRFWYGVETADGHRGWVKRDQVEALP